MHIGLITVFPEMLQALDYGVTGRAQERGQLKVTAFNPRDEAKDARHTVDDRPYGGGPGMVFMVPPLRDIIQKAKESLGAETPVIYLTPQGKQWNQEAALSLSQRPSLILLAGRYEGVDERLLKSAIDEEYSIGDYVLSGGELAAMVLIDSMARCLPGVLGHEDSAAEDSFSAGLLDYPHYTRPEHLPEGNVPPVLLGGDHAAIARWRLKQALGQTWKKRPDLLERKTLSKIEQTLLDEFKREEML